jgi:hypothetical protein
MKHFHLLLVLGLTVPGIYGQSNNDVSDSPDEYVIHFDKNDVQNWSEFEQYITNITQAESVLLNDKKNEFYIETYRVLDPKIIEGKLVKYGVDFIDLTTN